MGLDIDPALQGKRLAGIPCPIDGGKGQRAGRRTRITSIVNLAPLVLSFFFRTVWAALRRAASISGPI